MLLIDKHYVFDFVFSEEMTSNCTSCLFLGNSTQSVCFSDGCTVLRLFGLSVFLVNNVAVCICNTVLWTAYRLLLEQCCAMNACRSHRCPLFVYIAVVVACRRRRLKNKLQILFLRYCLVTCHIKWHKFTADMMFAKWGFV